MISLIDFGSPEYDESIALRNIVLRIPLGLQFHPADLATEYDSFHIAYYDNDNIVGILVMKPLTEGIVKMRQVAVHPDFQNKHIGSQMVGYSEVWANRHNFKMIELNARDTAVPFYLKLDYKVEGSPFEEVGITHSKMVKKL